MRPLPAVIRSHPRASGFLGSALIAWGSCHPEFSHGADGWPNPVVRAIGASLPQPLDWVVIVAGVVLLCAAWWSLRPSGPAGHQPEAGLRSGVLVTLAIWSAPLLLAPPILSADAVLYADLGWILQTGADPYLVGLTGAGGPFAPLVDPLWAGNGVAYPPGSLLVAQAVVAATGADPYWSVVAMRLPALAGVALIALTLPSLARRLGVPGDRALWLGLLNPLLIVHFVGGAHNDALMVGLAMTALWVALRRPHWAFGLLLGPLLVGWRCWPSNKPAWPCWLPLGCR
ncbi:MAG: polyprenol phosphomannose-dependent alpha 1,6 mannosyltransferase MptB [Micropruina sp.]|nr:polyprenol phosphomannose-dependent alpha 1,6 mannosyltransferase MptB [Micropruina sp.]